MLKMHKKCPAYQTVVTTLKPNVIKRKEKKIQTKRKTNHLIQKLQNNEQQFKTTFVCFFEC